MVVKRDKAETTEFIRLAQEAKRKVEEWPEWKKTIRLTKYSEGFGVRASSVTEKACDK
jgi:hypothetical protein